MNKTVKRKAKFLKSSPSLNECVETCLPEIALLGRSNVGKSTFINTISNSKVAKTSNKPGKTRLINQYEIDEKFLISDLPGYGFAHVSKTTQNDWQKNLEKYLMQRQNLKLFLQFIDSRHTLQENDYKMQSWLKFHQKKCLIVLSKIDLISKNKINQTISYYRKTLQNENVFAFSSKYQRFNELLTDTIETLLFQEL